MPAELLLPKAVAVLHGLRFLTNEETAISYGYH
jgi:hypothetical protein